MAYGWCSVVCESYSNLADGKNLLLLTLEIGFRHLNPHHDRVEAELTHTEYHQALVGIVFENGDCEVIGDLLHAWTSKSDFHESHPSLATCAGHLISLHNLQPFSSRLRRLVVRSIELTGYQGFGQVGFEGFVQLLNNLNVDFQDMDNGFQWAMLLMNTLQSPEGIQCSPQYWQLLVELTLPLSLFLRSYCSYDPQTIGFLKEAQAWDKLECWVGVIWMIWPPGIGGTTEEDLEHMMQLLFHQQPTAFQKLNQWMEQCDEEAPESFQQVCGQAYVKSVQ